MNKKLFLGLLAVVAVIAGGMIFSNYTKKNAGQKADDYLKSANTKTQADQTENEKQTKDTANILPIADGQYEINADGSRLAWVGKKTVVADWVDSGTIGVKKGSAVIANGQITEGKITIDMQSIAALTTGMGTGQDKLSKHLKSPDFFDSVKYLESVFDISKAELIKTENNIQTYKLTGSLTIKEITEPISFEAKLKNENGNLVLEGETKVDRTVWGITYGSSKLANAFIDDFFTLKMAVVANIKK